MKIADSSIKRPVTISMIMLAVVLIGVIAMTSLPQAMMPKMDLPIASVVTTMPGASPSEVEQQLSKPIEDALQTLSGVSEIDSTSLQNESQVTVQFNYGENLTQKVEDMRGIISGLTASLPSKANSPSVKQFDPNSSPIMTVTLSGADKSLSELSDIAANIVKPALQHVSGVGTVNEIGNLSRQINIEVDPQKLTYYGLSIDKITQAIQADNSSADVGQLNRGSQLVTLKVNGQFGSVNDLLQIPITIGSKAITVGNVAKLVDGYKDVTLSAALDSKPAIGFSIIQTSDGNTVKVSDAVRSEFQLLSKQLPAGVHLVIVSDSAQSIRDTVKLVAEHTILGFLLGILIMLCILRSLKTTIVIAVAIPISVLATFILMYLCNLSFNIITLGSLSIALGSLVDFSVVVLESIFRARITGLNPKEAASKGTAEVGTAVFVAALAQICVFVPSLFTGGIAGQIFTPMALTVTFSHVIALLVAVTLTPMMASKMLSGSRFAEEETIPGVNAPFRPWAPFDWFGKGMYKLTERYRKILKWGLDHRKTVIVSSMAMFLAVMPLIPMLGTELMTATNMNQVNVSITMPNSTNLSETTKTVETIEQRIKSHQKSVTSIYAQVGEASSSGQGISTNTASLIVTLNELEKESVTQVANGMQSYLQDIPGVKIIATPATAMSGASSGQVQVLIQGPDENTLKLLSNEVTNIMTAIPQLKYIDNQLATGLPTYQLNISHNALVQYGLTENQVTSALNTAFQGTTASTFYQGDKDYDVVVRFPQDYSRDVTKVLESNITSGTGALIPLSDLATLNLVQGASKVQHVSGTRSVYVNGNVFDTSTGNAQTLVQQKINALKIPAGYTVGFGQSSKFMSEAFQSLGIGILVSIVLVYMVMASLFESFSTPFVIMFSLPPTFVGAILGLYLTHKTINMNSLMGLIMLIGLVANNAIVLVDYTNQLREQGKSTHDALIQAGTIRLRPILLTTVTNVLAMLPMLIIGGKGSEGISSMAAVIAFGLTLSTLVTLVLVPVMYVNIDNFMVKRKMKKQISVVNEAL